MGRGRERDTSSPSSALHHLTQLVFSAASSTAIRSATFARPPTCHLCPDGGVMRATISVYPSHSHTSMPSEAKVLLLTASRFKVAEKGMLAYYDFYVVGEREETYPCGTVTIKQ